MLTMRNSRYNFVTAKIGEKMYNYYFEVDSISEKLVNKLS